MSATSHEAVMSRLDRLESRQRNAHRRMGAVAVVCIVMGYIAAPSSEVQQQNSGAHQETTSNRLVTRELLITDARGRVRAALRVADVGVVFHLLDEGGQSRATLAVGSDGDPSFALRGPQNGFPRALIAVTENLQAMTLEGERDGVATLFRSRGETKLRIVDQELGVELGLSNVPLSPSLVFSRKFKPFFQLPAVAGKDSEAGGVPARSAAHAVQTGQCLLVVAGGGSKVANDKVAKFWHDVRAQVADSLLQELTKDGVAARLELLPQDASPDKIPGMVATALAREACLQLAEVTHELGGGSGPDAYFAFEVVVFDVQKMDGGFKIGREAHRKKYRYPLNAETFKNLSLSALAGTMKADMTAAGVLRRAPAK